MFHGIYTALLTPFKNNEVDYISFGKMVEWQINSGVQGLVIAGSTGEGQSLALEELIQLLETALKINQGRIKIIANVGLNSTSKTLEVVRLLSNLNLNGIMLVAPYYVKPTQEGIFQHIKAVHDASNLPIMIYNNPGRACVDINNETIIRLSNLTRVVALKDSSGNPLRCGQLTSRVKKDFSIMAGDDVQILPFYSQRAAGTVSVTSNIVPSLVVKLHSLWQENKIQEAIEMQSLLRALNEILFIESNPIAVKYAASLFSLCTDEVRLPLTPLSSNCRALVAETIEELRAKLYERGKK